MLLPVVSLLAVFFAVHLYRTPRAVRRSYLASFRARHGVNLAMSLVVLATACLSGVVASVVHPGHLLAEGVIGAVLAGLALAGVIDLSRFRRR